MTPMARVASCRPTSCVPLDNGLVLVLGGNHIDFGPYKSVEVFDPAANGGAGGFKPAVDMSDFHSLTGILLPSGKVLLAGGNAQGTAELYSWP
jgi:hypothetical protein